MSEDTEGFVPKQRCLMCARHSHSDYILLCVEHKPDEKEINKIAQRDKSYLQRIVTLDGENVVYFSYG